MDHGFVIHFPFVYDECFHAPRTMGMKNHVMEAPLRQRLEHWLTSLDCDCFPIYLVGGAVRDLLLERLPKDIDLVCPDARNIATLLARQNRAALVPFEKREEMPCFRVVNREDPNDFLDISPIFGGTLVSDLQRRDFTVDAMAIEVLPPGKLGSSIDPHGGRKDLVGKRIRMTAPGVFQEDPLRVLRAFRLAAQLDFTIEEETLLQMQRQAPGLPQTAPERVTAELLALLETRRSSSWIRLMDDCGILEVLFPETRPMKGCVQNAFHHLDVWEHSLHVLENCEQLLQEFRNLFGPSGDHVQKNLQGGHRLPVLKLGALLHDVGKPATRDAPLESGTATFYGHDREGERIVREIAQRLRLSREDRTFLGRLTAEHLHVVNLYRRGVRPDTRMRWYRKLMEDSVPLALLAMADVKSTRGPASTGQARSEHLARLSEVISDYYGSIRTLLTRKDFVSGRDLIEMGMPPGPAMGRVLRQLREAQDQGRVCDRVSAMELARRLIKAL